MILDHNRGLNEHGATGVEYALVISFVSLVLVAAVVSLGGVFNVWVGNLVETIAALLS